MPKVERNGAVQLARDAKLLDDLPPLPAASEPAGWQDVADALAKARELCAQLDDDVFAALEFAVDVLGARHASSCAVDAAVGLLRAGKALYPLATRRVLQTPMSQSALMGFIRRAALASDGDEEEEADDVTAATELLSWASIAHEPRGIRTFSFDNGRITVQVAQLDLSDETDMGFKVWRSAVVACAWLTETDDGRAFAAANFAPGKRVLELGAGCGLFGLVAGALGADVVMTDYTATLVANLAHNVELNGLQARVRVRQFDWTVQPPPAALWAGEAFDIIVGIDSLYIESSVRGLLDTQHAFGTPPLLVGTPLCSRTRSFEAFAASARENGMMVQRLLEEDRSGGDGGDDSTDDISVPVVLALVAPAKVA